MTPTVKPRPRPGAPNRDSAPRGSTAKIYITLKPGLLDPQGKTTAHALEALGFRGVLDVRVGKYLELTLQATSTASAKKDVERMCQKLLANPVIESYRVEMAR